MALEAFFLSSLEDALKNSSPRRKPGSSSLNVLDSGLRRNDESSIKQLFPDGQRFCLLHRPETGVPVRGAIVYVQPFAEEMNKSRRMAALQARAMAVEGYFVLQIDLLGCGDSSGDFGEASWDAWVGDVVSACAWLRQQTDAPMWLWGLRTGCLLACEAAGRLDDAVNFLFWQPVVSGKQFLQQFLRLKVAGEMMTGEGRGVMEQMRQALAQGKPVEISGYLLGSALASGLESSELALPSRTSRVAWLEISGKPDAALSPAAAIRVEKWRAAGHQVRAHTVCGPTFWQTTEIEECPALLSMSLAVLRDTA